MAYTSPPTIADIERMVHSLWNISGYLYYFLVFYIVKIIIKKRSPFLIIFNLHTLCQFVIEKISEKIS